ncbi:DEAD/DEAH box helicase [Desulfosediminicola flagellatus]|uniref:DEAD/DEAH box helicase n=1 Tax=Desulfosediminicola flagellatus TaxID=2569541 RepID=UPI0010AC01DF|nr:DEAD/DEAH box helicase [Desulfosediminicola flagellatus]
MGFKKFNFSKQIHENIGLCGYSKPTPIQEQAISPILAGRDCVGLAQTGTGKTAAFVLPILEKLLSGRRNGTRAVIIAPTRELAEQIHQNVKSMARKTSLRSAVIYGGVGKQSQLKELRSGADIVVACPGRLLDLLGEPGVSLRNAGILVLDEADHMFDHGFLPDIKRIIQKLPKKRQNLIFSATMPKEIIRLIDNILTNPVRVQVNHTAPASTISHAWYKISQAKKTVLLKELLSNQDITSAVVFTRTKFKAKNLAIQLDKKGYSAVALQGNMSQLQRTRAMEGFRDGTFRVLVATDIAARGIDVSDISHVINYDLPDTAESYTHRTGRTGRAEKHGHAISFADKGDMSMIALVERNLGMKMSLETIELPQVIETPNRRPASKRPMENSPGSKQKRYAGKRKNSRSNAVSPVAR